MRIGRSTQPELVGIGAALEWKYFYNFFFTRLCRRQDTGDSLSRRGGEKGKKRQKGTF